MKAAQGLASRSFHLLLGMGLLGLVFSLDLLMIPYLKKEVTTDHPAQAGPAFQGESHLCSCFGDLGACYCLPPVFLLIPNPLSTPAFCSESKILLNIDQPMSVLMVQFPIVRS